MRTKTVTVTCYRHRCCCEVVPVQRGEGIRIRHAGDEALCDGEQFSVRREYSTGREGAHAELLVLCLNREAAEKRTAPSGAAGEDEGP